MDLLAIIFIDYLNYRCTIRNGCVDVMFGSPTVFNAVDCIRRLLNETQVLQLVLNGGRLEF